MTRIRISFANQASLPNTCCRNILLKVVINDMS